jgi:pimeloyl-ACP methyl ester carboxylesterase
MEPLGVDIMRALTDELTIRYEDQGAGEPALLFLPDFCTTRAFFGPLVERLRRSYHTLAMDLRGHGASDRPMGDFGQAEIVGDALAVIEASSACMVVPVAMSHAGWFALELRRRLGERIPALVVLDWMVGEPPPAFIDALGALQREDDWQKTRDALVASWTDDARDPAIGRLVRSVVGSFDAAMWARASRVIAAAYAREHTPLDAFARLDPPVSLLHLYSQPDDPGYLAMQRSFATRNPWYYVERLDGRSHFPSLEMPERTGELIERFVAARTAGVPRAAA